MATKTVTALLKGLRTSVKEDKKIAAAAGKTPVIAHATTDNSTWQEHYDEQKAHLSAIKKAEKSGQTPKKVAESWQTTAGGTYPVQGTPFGSGPNLKNIGTSQQTLDPTRNKKAKAAKVKTTTPTASAVTATALEKSIATGSFGKILSSVADQYQVAQQSAATAASGSLTAPATQGAWAEALQSLSGTPATLGENPSAWLSQNLATAQQVEAPLQSALSAYGQQYQAEQGPILSNLASLGQGLELGVDTAPEQAWLQALSSHITENLAYKTVIPTAALSMLPSSIATALQQSGGYGSSGVTSIQNLTTKGATAKVKTSTGVGTALTGGGTVPGSSPYPT